MMMMMMMMMLRRGSVLAQCLMFMMFYDSVSAHHLLGLYSSDHPGLFRFSDSAVCSTLGSMAHVWDNFYNPKSFHIAAKIVVGVPNDAREPFWNAQQLEGNVVLIDRGGNIPIYDKVKRAQDTGAVGVLVVHDQPSEFSRTGYLNFKDTMSFVQHDGLEKWKHIRIPSGLITMESGQRIKDELGLRKMEFRGVGEQYVMEDELDSF